LISATIGYQTMFSSSNFGGLSTAASRRSPLCSLMATHLVAVKVCPLRAPTLVVPELTLSNSGRACCIFTDVTCRRRPAWRALNARPQRHGQLALELTAGAFTSAVNRRTVPLAPSPPSEVPSARWSQVRLRLSRTCTGRVVPYHQEKLVQLGSTPVAAATSPS
jgi:hypothetical protein